MIKKAVILVHGFNKNRDDMLYLNRKLKEAGYLTCSVNLPTTFGSLDDILFSFDFQIRELASSAEKLFFVAHSMGGLIVRNYISANQNNVGGCVFIATPHAGSKLAKIANQIPGFSEIFNPIKIMLPENKFFIFWEIENFV